MNEGMSLSEAEKRKYVLKGEECECDSALFTNYIIHTGVGNFSRCGQCMKPIIGVLKKSMNEHLKENRKIGERYENEYFETVISKR